MSPDDWYNIPVCLVKAVNTIIEQFNLLELRLNNFTFYHREHLRKRELQMKGLEHYVARSNDTLRTQIDKNCNLLFEKVLKYNNDNSLMNKRTQQLITQTRDNLEEQRAGYES